LETGIVFPYESIGVEISAEVENSLRFVEVCVTGVVICADPVVKVNMFRVPRIKTNGDFIVIFTAPNPTIKAEACQSIVKSITSIILMRPSHLNFIFARAVVHFAAQMSR
jgi:hypothetical protein